MASARSPLLEGTTHLRTCHKQHKWALARSAGKVNATAGWDRAQHNYNLPDTIEGTSELTSHATVIAAMRSLPPAFPVVPRPLST